MFWGFSNGYYIIRNSGEVIFCLTQVEISFWQIMHWRFYPPGLKAEAVLNKDGDAEEDHTLYGHGKQVFSHHVPGQRRAEPVLTYRDASRTRGQAFNTFQKNLYFPCHWKWGHICNSWEKRSTVITKSLQSVRHCLILHHVNQSSAQTKVREDEEHVL